MGQVAATIKGKTVATVGETVILEGLTEFHPSVIYLKWQKKLDGEYVDINIHKSKYKGSENSVRNPKLVLNDIDLEDGGYYRIKFEWISRVDYSSVHRLSIQPHKETITMIGIQPDQINGKYYVGEDVIIQASLRNVSKILCMTWQNETENGSNTIDTSLEKYMESRNDEACEYTLTIRNCNELDKGTYFLLTACTDNLEVKSNRIKLDFVREKPEVIFNHVSKAVYDTVVKYEASIRSFIKHTSTVWKKGGETININSPKYRGSLNDGCHPVLYIHNVNEEDEDDYTIHVSNKWGETTLDNRLVLIGKEPTVCLKLSDQSQKVAYGNTITLQAEIKSYPVPWCIRWTRIKNENKEENIDEIEKCTIDKSEKSCQTLTIKNLDFTDNGNYIITVTNDFGSVKDNLEINVDASQMIFISGPVVVSPSENIKFLTMFTSNQNCLNAKWFKIKEGSEKEIDFGSTKYIISNTSDGTKTQAFDVVLAEEEDSAGYQLTIGGFRSNMINTFVKNDSAKFCTETQGNFFRCFDLQRVCLEAVRNVFDNLPDAFEDKIKNFKETCLGQKDLKNILKSLEKNKPSSSKDLDVTLICAIIQNLNYIENPKKGWGREPDKNDIGISDDLERIRQYRNFVCHNTSFEIDTNDFNKAVLDIIWAIRRLSKNDVKMMEDINDIMNRVIAPGETVEEMIVQVRIIQKETKELEDYFGIKEFHWETQTTEREKKFHQVCDSVISLHNNSTIATYSPIRRLWCRSDSGVCFTNRPLKVDEKVHIRGTHFCYGGEQHRSIKLGLTDINPYKVREAVNKKEAIGSALTPIHCCDNPLKEHDYWLEGFHLCISLLQNARLAICLNDGEQRIYDCQIDSTYYPLWLVIELDNMASIWISHV